MATWDSHGRRGTALEELVNHTNEIYREKGLALIQKIPTPIKPVNIDEASSRITLAYFESKSTIDYMGAVQGIPVCFDAKETGIDNLPLYNVHEHQMEFMEAFEKQGGVAFFLVMFTGKNETFYLPFRDMKRCWERANEGGRKSIAYAEFDPAYRIQAKGALLCHYLEGLARDLAQRDEAEEK
ncbi:MAG: Holliday junction resolvase RecU [Lachnospiraceae bacterium]|nr:Holliday junction resolvase RecU [Lachnospiraceae bacterium]